MIPVEHTGRCIHCQAFIGAAVKSHEAHCELRPKPTYTADREHDSFEASKGRCLCPYCLADRAS